MKAIGLKSLNIFTLSLLALSSCNKITTTVTSGGNDPQNQPREFVLKREEMLDPTTIDKDVSACDDFYKYACGNWIKNTTLADEYPRWMRSFSTMTQLNLIEQRKILDSLATAENLDSDSIKLKDLYGSCNNTEAAEGNFADLQKQLIELDLLTTDNEILKKLPSVIADLNKRGTYPFFGLFAGQDEKNAQQMIANLDRSGLALYNRDIDPAYYTDDKYKELRAQYLKHIENMFLLAKYAPQAATQAALDAFEVETKIAQKILGVTERRDPEKVYNKKTAAELQALSPSFSWKNYITALGAPAFTDLNIVDLGYITALETILADLNSSEISNYLKWQLINDSAPSLGAAFVAENFDFFGKKLLGQQAMTPRWKKCAESASDSLTDVMGRKYSESQFSPQSKDDTVKLTQNIRAAYEEIISKLDWMDDETKAKALEKLKKITQKIGYPDKWDDYKDLEISATNYLLNKQKVAAFSLAKNLKEIGQATDKSKWHMPVPMVNAYYSPNLNEIVFPAGILASPFYDPKAPPAANYGAIGMVIGHEITHGFDDQGRQYDGDGNLKSWWSDASAAKFKEKAACVVEQYNKFEIDGNYIKGQQTLGENTADLGGIKIAYAGFLKANPSATLEDKKNFFLAFAQGWCGKVRPEFIANQIQSGVHSPSQFRVNGPLVNLEAFSEVYGCAKGSPMNPEQKCAIW